MFYYSFLLDVTAIVEYQKEEKRLYPPLSKMAPHQALTSGMICYPADEMMMVVY